LREATKQSETPFFFRAPSVFYSPTSQIFKVVERGRPIGPFLFFVVVGLPGLRLRRFARHPPRLLEWEGGVRTKGRCGMGRTPDHPGGGRRGTINGKIALVNACSSSVRWPKTFSVLSVVDPVKESKSNGTSCSASQAPSSIRFQSAHHPQVPRSL